MNDSKETIVFYHLPKTAGTTLGSIIRQNYAPDKIVSSGIDTHAFLADLKTWPLEKRRRIRLLHGHVPFGTHELLPQPTRYFTVLRHPVERTISYYFHAMRDPNHYLYDLINHKKMPLKELIESGEALMMNDGQTRLLSAVFGDVSVGCITNEHLKTAISNLNKMEVVGLTEKFNATLILLQQAFNWQHIYYTKSNVGTNRQTITELDQVTLETVTKYNQQDLHLYLEAQEIFKTQIKRNTPGFQLKLSAFILKHKIHHFSIQYYLQRLFNIQNS
jgi:hypothetical protein